MSSALKSALLVNQCVLRMIHPWPHELTRESLDRHESGSQHQTVETQLLWGWDQVGWEDGGCRVWY